MYNLQFEQAHQAIQFLSSVTPAYTTAQAAAITGVVQTIEAYNYIMIADDHDTLGAAIQPANLGSSLPRDLGNPVCPSAGEQRERVPRTFRDARIGVLAIRPSRHRTSLFSRKTH